MLLPCDFDTQPQDDTSVNGAISADPYEEEGEPWDCDSTFPEDAEGEEDEDE